MSKGKANPLNDVLESDNIDHTTPKSREVHTVSCVFPACAFSKEVQEEVSSLPQDDRLDVRISAIVESMDVEQLKEISRIFLAGMHSSSRKDHTPPAISLPLSVQQQNAGSSGKKIVGYSAHVDFSAHFGTLDSSIGEDATFISPDAGTLANRKSIFVVNTLDKHTCEVSGLDQINDYIVLDHIADGSFGSVFVAQDIRTDELLAMKLIKRDRFAKRSSVIAIGEDSNNLSESVEQIDCNREVAIMKKLKHPHIVKLREVIDDPTDNKIYLFMDLVEGGTIAPTLDLKTGKCDPIESSLLRKYFWQTVDGLHYLHKHRIIHRDLKPDNILLDTNGNVVLVDFGVSQVTKKKGLVIGTAGTPAFMAPELWASDGDDALLGAASDVWSLGVSMYMLLVGHSPFHGATRNELIHSVQHDDLTIPDEFEEWKEILTKMLIKAPSKRISLSTIRRHKFFAHEIEMEGESFLSSPVLSKHRPAINLTEIELAGAIQTREVVDDRKTPKGIKPATFSTSRTPKHNTSKSQKLSSDVNGRTITFKAITPTNASTDQPSRTSITTTSEKKHFVRSAFASDGDFGCSSSSSSTRNPGSVAAVDTMSTRESVEDVKMIISGTVHTGKE